MKTESGDVTGLSPGTVIGAYTVVGRVGMGGMAAVYVVRRRGPSGFEKLLAMKVMLPHLAEEARFVDMFLDEIRIASRIEHPNVVSVIDAGEHKGAPWMVMELLRGKNLSQLLRRSKIPKPEAMSILEQAARGLHAAHECRDAEGALLELVHRDFTPQNLHVSYDGVVKVVDFGIATAVGRLTTTQTGEMKGKLAYVSPAQISGDPLGRRTDIWAFGVLAWEVLTHHRLFAGKNDAEVLWNVMHKKVPPVRSIARDVSQSVAQIIEACLERDVDKRPATAAELATLFGEEAIRLGSSARDVSALVERLFEADKITEAERLAAAQREEPAALLLTGTPSSMEGADVAAAAAAAVAAPGPSRPPWALLGGILVALFGVGVGLWGATRAPATADPPDAAAQPEAPDPPEPPAAEPQPPEPLQMPLVIVETARDAGARAAPAPEPAPEVVHRRRRVRRGNSSGSVDPLRAPDVPF